MNFSKDQLKDLWTTCLKTAKGGQFVDGLVLGTLVRELTHGTEESQQDEQMSMFQDWQQSIDEMGFEDDKKKILMYSTYLTTYYRGKKTDPLEADLVIKKRQLKGILKTLAEDNNQTIIEAETNAGSNESVISPQTKHKYSTSEEEEKTEIQKENKVQFAEKDQVNTFQKVQNKKDDEDYKPYHKCSFCHKLSQRTKILNDCNHYIHLGCLKMKTISTLICGKYKVFCHDRDCTSMIGRDHIVKILTEKGKTCYDSLNFMAEYALSEPEKALFWCYKCRLISSKYVDEVSKCSCCGKRQDKLKSVFTLAKLVLVEKDSKNRDHKNYEAISKCVEDCKQQLPRCESCKMWKHGFPGISQKCLC